MNTRQIRTIFYYSMIALLGIIFVILGIIFKNGDVIFHRMIKVGLGLLIVGIIFLLGSLKMQSNEKNDKILQRFNNAKYDERNQLIAGKSASIATDIMWVLGMLACCVLSFFGMDNYSYILIGYIVINNLLQLGVSIYLRHEY